MRGVEPELVIIIADESVALFITHCTLRMDKMSDVDFLALWNVLQLRCKFGNFDVHVRLGEKYIVEFFSRSVSVIKSMDVRGGTQKTGSVIFRST